MFDTAKVATVILGGGEGRRLFPLTKYRCKPSIPFGQYRLIDIPISNSLHAGIRRIFVITQFLSTSLHRHILSTYRLDHFSHGFIEMLTPERKPGRGEWYAGTADAVRQNIEHLEETLADYFLILSGDQLYNMDFKHMLSFAVEKDADLTIGALQIDEKDASRMGVMRLDANHRIIDFVEKPKTQEELSRVNNGGFFGSMGIYVFKRQALFDLLMSDEREDFGKHLIPSQIEQGKVYAYPFDGYWEDIGTISSFHKASIALTEPDARFDCYRDRGHIFTAHDHLPSAKVISSHLDRAIIGDGSLIEGSRIERSILGSRCRIAKGCEIKESVLFGNDLYAHIIDEGCVIKGSIIDRNVSIGKNVRLINRKGLTDYDGDHIFIREGIIIVIKGANLPSGFEL